MARLNLPVPKLVGEVPTLTGHFLNENSNSLKFLREPELLEAALAVALVAEGR